MCDDDQRTGSWQDNVKFSAAKAPLALSIDIGSSSIRSMVFDSDGRSIIDFSLQIPYELYSGADGQVTIDAGRILDTAVACIDGSQKTLQQHNAIVSVVGVSCFWHSLLGLNAMGKPSTPVYHLADNRSADIVDTLRLNLEEPAWKRVVGTRFHSSYWPAKLLWLRDRQPEAEHQVTTWVSIADYLSALFNGSIQTSLCMASGTGMCDISSGEWSQPLCQELGIATSTLPTIVDRTDALVLLEPWRSRWPMLADASWFPPLGDGACANVGCGATTRRRIALTLGTTGAMRVMSTSVVGEPVEVPDELWTYRLDRSSILHGGAITNGGGWLDFLRDIIGDSDASVLDDAFATEPAAHGLTILPFLAGERSPIWNDRARAVVAGLGSATTRTDLIRAGLESVAHRLALVYASIAPVADTDHKIVANGAALLKSPGWQQIVSDALGHEIVTLPATLEASARGAALCALEAAGLISDLVENADPVVDSKFVTPDDSATMTYRLERDRQETLRAMLYPDSTSWDS
ncbi:gluconokinase [soil metagenome]